jgi:glycosyltransferase involved in cell wall biosynthesis
MWGPVARRLFWLANRLLRWSNWTVLTAVSNAAALPVAQAASLPAAEVFITSNGVDLAGWAPLHPVEDLTRPLHLVSATRFAPRKRVLPLIEMLAQLKAVLGDECPTLTIVGNGPALERARARVRQLGIENTVSLPGRVDRATLANLYAQSSAFIQLSVRESFGLAAIEARAAGLPVLGRAGNGFSEFITSGTDGYLEPSDAGVKARLIHLVERPEVLKAMREYARLHPPLNTWELALAQVQRAYEAAMGHGLR